MTIKRNDVLSICYLTIEIASGFNWLSFRIWSLFSDLFGIILFLLHTKAWFCIMYKLSLSRKAEFPGVYLYAYFFWRNTIYRVVVVDSIYDDRFYLTQNKRRWFEKILRKWKSKWLDRITVCTAHSFRWLVQDVKHNCFFSVFPAFHSKTVLFGILKAKQCTQQNITNISEVFFSC